MEKEEQVEVQGSALEDEASSSIGDGRWEEVCGALRLMVSRDAYQRWFGASRLVEVEGGRATVAVPNEIHQVWIETNYLPELTAAVAGAYVEVHEVKVVVAESAEAVAEIRSGNAARDDDDEEAVLAADASLEKRAKAAGLNPSFTFARFVVGANSQFAHAACEAVAKKQGVGYNPLFIHGGSGLGKTHLMQAIGYEWLRRMPGARVVYLTCEKFTNEFIDAVRRGDIEKFRRRYRTAEVMLIDDVQFLTGKERSQEEFFHTFNTLLDGRRQVVLSSDRPASQIKSLEPRLVSRFECGLAVQLQPPLVETRTAILRKKMEEWKVRIDDSIVQFLAERIHSNVRRLEGALMRVATYASLSGETVGPDKLEYLLRDLLREEATRQVSIDSIQKAVAEHFELRLADMTSRRRPANIAFARQVAMYLSRTLTKGSLIEIGEAFGGRDHGTVIHACRKVAERIEGEPDVRETVSMLESLLRH